MTPKEKIKLIFDHLSFLDDFNAMKWYEDVDSDIDEDDIDEIRDEIDDGTIVITYNVVYHDEKTGKRYRVR